MGNSNEGTNAENEQNNNEPAAAIKGPDGKELMPITFQQFGDPQEEARARQQLAKASWFSKGTGSSSRFISEQPLTKTSKVSKTGLKMQDLTVVSENAREMLTKDESKDVSVPFSVVRISIEDQLMTCIKDLNDDFLQEQEKDSSKPDNFWKMNAKGIYYRRLLQGNIAIVKPGFLYQGGYLLKDNHILPNEFGTLCTTKGKYAGQFKMGEAHGKGTYTDLDLRTEAKGQWIKGQIQKGSISNDDFIFSGKFHKAIADGKGMIKYKLHDSCYKGIFREGIFEDQDGYFESQDYDYSGGFKNGKKNGIGCLIQKERYIRTKLKKYKPQEQYEGYFQDDYYIGKTNPNPN